MKKIINNLRDSFKESIAICLYKLGKKPNVTMFIDEHTVMYGYGKCFDCGFFEYNLPAIYIKKKNNENN